MAFSVSAEHVSTRVCGGAVNVECRTVQWRPVRRQSAQLGRSLSVGPDTRRRRRRRRHHLPLAPIALISHATTVAFHLGGGAGTRWHVNSDEVSSDEDRRGGSAASRTR